MDRRLRTVIAEISRDNSTSLQLPELASSVNLSVRRLEQLFKEETGLTYIAFRRRLRMNLAQRLVKGSSKSVNEITSLVGYKAAEYFCREFKKARGRTAMRFPQERQEKTVVDVCFYGIRSHADFMAASLSAISS